METSRMANSLVEDGDGRFRLRAARRLLLRLEAGSGVGFVGFIIVVIL